MIIAAFAEGAHYLSSIGLWQYDYGQTLRIQGLQLPPAVEIHFSLDENGGTSTTRVGVTKDGVTDVVIPDVMLENGGIDQNYKIYAFIYLADAESGQTVKKISIHVKSRPRPEAFDTPEDAELFREAIQAVAESAESARSAVVAAESWASRAQETAEKIPGYVEDAKKDIDDYVTAKEGELKGEPGPQGPQGPQGEAGKNGSDANVTSENITKALGYTPANDRDKISVSYDAKNKIVRFLRGG